MIVEKGHFHFAEKYWGAKAPLDQRCSVEKVFLEISQNSQENTCARIYFSIKLRA